MLRAALFVITVASASGCHPRAPGRDPNAEERRATYRTAGECADGDGTACGAPCTSGGPTESCERACDYGHAASCAELAVRHDNGFVIPSKRKAKEKKFPPDRARAAALYDRACKLLSGADAGEDLWVCAEAGKRFANGDGVLVDERRANNAYRHACKLGGADSCVALGKRCAESPETCSENESARAFARACKLGKKDVCSNAAADE